MPKIEDLQRSQKKFKKSNYRPWNFLNELEKEAHELENIPAKTLHKPNTNLTQNPTRTLHKPNTKLTQAKQVEILKPNTEPNTKSNTNPTQTLHKLNTNQTFSTLVGNQRKVLFYIFQKCNFSAKNELILTNSEIIENLSIPQGSVNTTLVRLQQAGLIDRTSYKNGRGGWKKIKLNELVYKEMFLETLHKPNTNPTQTPHKPYTKPNTEPNTNAPSSSSSSIYNNITTTTELPKEWEEIDLSSIEHIGFSKNHLSQLYKIGSLDPKSVQDSIEYFSFDLLNNNKGVEIKTNPLGYFIGILKRFGVYAPPENYESPKDRAMRLYLENQKEINKKRESMENELLNISFNEWEGQLSAEEKNKILPDEIKQQKIQSPKTAYLKKYFKENIWDKKRIKTLTEIGGSIKP